MLPNRYYLFGILIVFLYMSMFFILGQNSYIKINDNLDLELVNRVVEARHFLIFNDFYPEFINGLTSGSLPGLGFVTLLFVLFKPFTAYVLNELVIRIIGFLGMFVLLNYILKPQDKKISFLVAVCFSLLPIYSLYGLSVLGQPLLLYCFLNLIDKNIKTRYFIFIFLFAFYSSLYLAGIFIAIAILLFVIYNFIKNKKINIYPLLGLGLLTASYIISEYKSLLLNLGGFVSHRTEFDLFLSNSEALKTIAYRFVIGQYHFASVHTLILILAFFILSWIITIKKDSNKEVKTVLWLILICFIISVFSGIYQTEAFGTIKDNMKIFKQFQFDRFYILFPLLWSIIFAYCLVIINRLRNGKYIVVGLIILQVIILLLSNSEFMYNTINLKSPERVSFNSYYSTDLYGKVSDSINQSKENYRVLSIGLDPMVAVYNGFYTLDGYFSLYSLDYKHKFRKIISGELDKSRANKDYFDKWGNRVYIFINDTTKEYYELNLNFSAVRDIEPEKDVFILSDKKIINLVELNLEYIDKIFDKDSTKDIYVYKLLK